MPLAMLRRIATSLAAMLVCLAVASNPSQAQTSAPSTTQSEKAALDRVLTQMDSAAATFRSLEADFVWDQVNVMFNDTDTQKGKLYVRHESSETLMAADISLPISKYLLYSGGKVQIYEPKIDQVTIYKPGKDRGDIEGYLLLGFGSRGHDLPKAYDVHYQGTEKVAGIEVTRLELIPKSDKARNLFPRILLWVDPERGISIQQQLFQSGGDYRLAKYSDIQLNHKLADDRFKLKTGGKTKVVAPQG